MSNNQQSQDALMESYLKLVGEEYARSIGEEYDEIPEDIDYPKSLDQWFKAFNGKIKKINKAKKRKANSYKYFIRIAAAFVAVLIVSTVITLNVDALRVEVLNFFIEQDNRSMHIQAGRTAPGDAILEEHHGLYVLGYVPEGFVLEEVNNMDSFMVSMSYVYQDRYIRFSQEGGQVDIQIDNERSVITEYQLSSGENAIVSEWDGYSLILWENDRLTFMITGDIDGGSLIKMAESMVWKE